MVVLTGVVSGLDVDVGGVVIVGLDVVVKLVVEDVVVVVDGRLDEVEESVGVEVMTEGVVDMLVVVVFVLVEVVVVVVAGAVVDEDEVVDCVVEVVEIEIDVVGVVEIVGIVDVWVVGGIVVVELVGVKTVDTDSVVAIKGVVNEREVVAGGLVLVSETVLMSLVVFNVEDTVPNDDVLSVGCIPIEVEAES